MNATPYLVDSHCHLNRLALDKYDGSIEQAVTAAWENRIHEILTVCTSLTEFPELLALTQTFSHVSCSLGLHPSEIVEKEPTTEELIQLAEHSNVVAIGETGLDYHYQFVGPKIQQERFRRHIQVAKAVKKPIIIHIRDSAQDMLTILKEEQADEIGGVLHCFTDTWDVAKTVLDYGFYISFSGILTFRKATQVQDVAKKVPLERMLIETDAPYLAPHPMRGKPNEPAFLRYTAEYLAKLLNLSFDEIAVLTTNNFKALFESRA